VNCLQKYPVLSIDEENRSFIVLTNATLWLYNEADTIGELVMGHIRLSTLPRTHRWKQVIDLLVSREDIPGIVQASLRAAQTGLRRVPDDAGFVLTLTNIFNFVEAAKSADWSTRIARQTILDVSWFVSQGFRLFLEYENHHA
jgi:hypothetical protein